MRDPRILNLRDLRRRRGRGFVYELPADASRVDRATPFGNPFPIRGMVARDAAIDLYRTWLRHELADRPAFLEPLRGRRLACWCSPLRCHAEVILEALDAPSIEAWRLEP